jgi:hypothetical protein
MLCLREVEATAPYCPFELADVPEFEQHIPDFAPPATVKGQPGRDLAQFPDMKDDEMAIGRD